MTKKINFKDKKNLDVKVTEEIIIGTDTFKKGETYKLDLDDIDEDLDVKHKEDLPINKIKGKLQPKKAKSDDGEPQKIDVIIKGKFNNGYFWDSFDIEELKVSTGETCKINEYSLRTGADLMGVNYWGWGGIVIALILVAVGGYYWWTSYNKEEEEENI